MVRDAFLTDELIRIDCQGLERRDYKKIGCKLRVKLCYIHPLCESTCFNIMNNSIYLLLLLVTSLFILEIEGEGTYFFLILKKIIFLLKVYFV